MSAATCRIIPDSTTVYAPIHIIKQSQSRNADTRFIKVCVALMAGFIVIAALQAFQLNALLSGAKDVKSDLIELKAEQASISREYIAYIANLKKIHIVTSKNPETDYFSS